MSLFAVCLVVWWWLFVLFVVMAWREERKSEEVLEMVPELASVALILTLCFALVALVFGAHVYLIAGAPA